jgi:hypothetical protein
MDRSLALLLIGLVFGGGIGFVVAAGTGVTLDGHDHAADIRQAMPTDHPGRGGAGDHETPHSLTAGADAPMVGMTLTPDPVAGWNLHVTTDNFSFAPEKAGKAHVPGEGHGHVHVDGEKIARLYGAWMHIPALPSGATVTVTLNANDHRPLAIGSTPISASVQVAVE